LAALCQTCHAAACSTCNAPDACTGSLHTSFTYQTAGMHTSCVHNVIIALASSKQTGSTSYSPRYTCMQKERLRRTGITTHGFSSAWCTPFKELYICCARHTADKAWSRLQCRRRLHASDLGGLGAGGACTVSARCRKGRTSSRSREQCSRPTERTHVSSTGQYVRQAVQCKVPRRKGQTFLPGQVAQPQDGPHEQFSPAGCLGQLQ